MSDEPSAMEPMGVPAGEDDARLAATEPAATTDAGAAATGSVAETPFPPFQAEYFLSHLFWLVIAFGILYYAMTKLVVPQVGGILEDRRDRIAGDLGEANRLKRETDEIVAAYERELAEARAKAHAEAQRARDEVKRELAERQATTERELQEKIAAAEKTIAEMRDRALSEVDRIAGEAAKEIVAKISPVEIPEGEVETAIASRRAAA